MRYRICLGLGHAGNNTVRNKNEAIRTLLNTNEDMEKFERYVLERPTHLTESVGAAAGSKATATKEDALKKTEEFFLKCRNHAKKNNIEALIYFSGHGEETTGNWEFEKKQSTLDGLLGTATWYTETVSLDEIVQKMNLCQYKGPLTLWCDCCFSGAWVEKVKENVDKGDPSYKQVTVVAASSGKNPADAGVFSNYMFKGGHTEINATARHMLHQKGACWTDHEGGKVKIKYF
jgi:hypothetical protein